MKYIPIKRQLNKQGGGERVAPLIAPPPPLQHVFSSAREKKQREGAKALNEPER